MNIKSFTINCKGSTTGQSYTGLFKAKTVLSHREKMRFDEIRRSLLGEKPNEATEDANGTAKIFAKISVHIVESPSWWKDANGGVDLFDEEPIQEVLTQILKAEAEAVEAVRSEADKAAKELKEMPK